MTTVSTTVSAPAFHRSWRAVRIVPLLESAYRARLVLAPVMLAIQIFLYYRLWIAVYANATSVGGLDVRQVVTYSTIALLIARIRWSARGWSRDSIMNRVREGTIIYFFLRPISPRRYTVIRALGEMGYGAGWALVGYVVMVGSGAIDGPTSAGSGVVFGISVVLGQAILFLLSQCVELSVFWFGKNAYTERLYYFAQDLLAGVFVPLWFLPDWLFAAARYSPFGSAINVPLSLYVGRIPLQDAPRELLMQLGWIAALTVLNTWVWRRASRRIEVQGG